MTGLAPSLFPYTEHLIGEACRDGDETQNRRMVSLTGNRTINQSFDFVSDRGMASKERRAFFPAQGAPQRACIRAAAGEAWA